VRVQGRRARTDIDTGVAPDYCCVDVCEGPLFRAVAYREFLMRELERSVVMEVDLVWDRELF